ncbi:MAG: response regulator [Caulobacteraceae bacterium]
MDSDKRDGSVLVFAPIGRDAPTTADLLHNNGLECVICPDLNGLITEIGCGAGAIVLAEEGLFGKDLAPLTRWVSGQPAWSDLPFIVLTSRHEQAAVAVWRRNLVSALRNVSLLERPIRPITLVSAAQSALRARHRQYEVRALIKAREQAAQELERLVVERTAAIEAANDQLRAEMAQRERIEESLLQAQKMEAIGQLTGGIAHDFNNLLMVISGGLQILERQTDPGRRRRLMEGMDQAARRGAGLTRQLLTFSRRQAFRPEPVDIARQIGGMRELLDRSLSGDVDVEFEFPDALWPVQANPGQLELVVLNLAVNARDAMPKGGTIVLKAENLPSLAEGDLKGDFVCLSVIDTGMGMTPQVRARVFEPYFTTKDVGKGSGLGLAQVYGFAAQSRGAVRIDSEVGRGTCVALYLPKSDEAPSSEPRRLEKLHADGRPGHIAGRVLLVEDDVEVAALVSEMLGQLGYKVTWASGPAAALSALANRRSIDVVFSDIMMPGSMNGIELAREIRRKRAGLPVVLTSGFAEASAQDATSEGICVLPKPFGLEELSAALDAATSERAIA